MIILLPHTPIPRSYKKKSIPEPAYIKRPPNFEDISMNRSPVSPTAGLLHNTSFNSHNFDTLTIFIAFASDREITYWLHRDIKIQKTLNTDTFTCSLLLHVFARCVDWIERQDGRGRSGIAATLSSIFHNIPSLINNFTNVVFTSLNHKTMNGSHLWQWGSK